MPYIKSLLSNCISSSLLWKEEVGVFGFSIEAFYCSISLASQFSLEIWQVCCLEWLAEAQKILCYLDRKKLHIGTRHQCAIVHFSQKSTSFFFYTYYYCKGWESKSVNNRRKKDCLYVFWVVPTPHLKYSVSFLFPCSSFAIQLFFKKKISFWKNFKYFSCWSLSCLFYFRFLWVPFFFIRKCSFLL